MNGKLELTIKDTIGRRAEDQCNRLMTNELIYIDFIYGHQLKILYTSVLGSMYVNQLFN